VAGRGDRGLPLHPSSAQQHRQATGRSGILAQIMQAASISILNPGEFEALGRFFYSTDFADFADDEQNTMAEAKSVGFNSPLLAAAG